MQDPSRTHQELIEEISVLKQKNKELEQAETERKMVEESLKQSEAHSRLLTDHMKDHVWLMDLNLKPTYISPSVEKCRGYTLEEIMQLPLDKHLTATSLQSAMEFFSIEMPKAMADPTYYLTRSLELEFCRKDGSTYWLENTFSLIRDENGKALSLLGVGRDITDRKRVEDELRKSQEQLRNAHQLAHIGVWNWIANTDTVTWTEELYRIAGLDPILPAPTYAEHSNIYTPESWDRLKVAVAKALETGEHYQLELELIRPDGATRWVNAFGGTTYDNHGLLTGLQGTVQDITERKLAEEKRRLSEARLAEAQAVAKIGSWETDLSNLKVIWSKETYRIFEIDPESFHSSHPGFLAFVHPDDRAKVDAAFTGSIDKHSPNAIEHRIVTPGGIVKFIEERWQIFHDDKGLPIRAVGTCQDITARKLGEVALSESEERFRVAQELSPDGFTILRPVRDSGGRVIDFTWVYENSAIARLNGTDPNAIEGMRLLELFPGHRGTAILDTYQEVAESGESRIMEAQYQGESIPTPIWFRLVVVSMGSDIAILAQNITEGKQAEEQIKSSLKEKEVLLKELQHRVKNNLLTISGILALQLERIKDRDSKDIFITSINRINAMTRIHNRLYQSDNYSLINFKGYIEELAWELSRSYGFPPENMITNVEDISIDINTAIPTGLIVNELVSNAMKHAFPSLGVEDKGTGELYRDRKGEITITLKESPTLQPVLAGEAMTKNSEAPCSSLVILTVSDNGIGFPAHIDFRSTESVGLSLLVKLVEQINGSMELIRDNGTIFIITFSRD